MSAVIERAAVSFEPELLPGFRILRPAEKPLFMGFIEAIAFSMGIRETMIVFLTEEGVADPEAMADRLLPVLEGRA